MEFEPKSEEVRVVITGDVDDRNDAELKKLLAEAVAERPRTLTIDLGSAHHFGSHGVNVVVSTWRDLHDRGAELVLVNAPPRIRTVLEVCQIVDLPGLRVID